jgi:hypothetical protein
VIRRDKDVRDHLDDYFKKNQYIEEVPPVSVLEKVRIESRTEGAILGNIEDALRGLEIGFDREGIAKQTKLPSEFVDMLADAAGDVTAESAYEKYVEMYKAGA